MTARLRPDGAQRAEADAEVADPRRIALEDVEAAAVPSPPKKSPLIGRRQQGAARDAELVRAARRREDAEVDLGRALGRARRAADDGDLVDDDVAAAQERARSRRPRPRTTTIRTGIVTHAHSRRSRRREDEVVDRPDEQDVGTAGARSSPPIGGSASDGSWRGGLDDLAVVADDRRAARARSAGAGATGLRRRRARRSSPPSGRSR